jgi:small subunit ribosomal protein S8
VVTDPIADMLTRIRNAQSAGHKKVNVPSSGIKKQIARVLQEEGYIANFAEVKDSVQPNLQIELKYFNGKPVIEEITRVSTSGRRQYRKVADLPKKRGGLGIYIVSTSKGVMSDHQARRVGQGGELICAIA